MGKEPDFLGGGLFFVFVFFGVSMWCVLQISDQLSDPDPV